VGLTAAAVARGARVYEHSEVRSVRTGQRHVELRTESAALQAEAVVIATSAPLADLRSLRRHLHAEQVYGVVTEPLLPPVRRQVGARTAVLERASTVDAGGVRWVADDRVFVQGGRQPVVPTRSRDRALTQRTGQLMYELLLMYPAIAGLQPAWAWDAVDVETTDGLPLLGTHRRFPRHFFAYGSSRHGVGLAWVAARMALHHTQATPAAADEAFGFSRIL
jgi:glycine/D-amino acid oxidase-like deaminating enzyme